MRIARASLAAALLLAAMGAARADDLGTLFYSPAEREQLDRMRRGEAVEAPAGAPLPREHAVTGYVQRSDGRGTVWIDGRAVRVADPKAERVFDPHEVRAYSKSAEQVKIEAGKP
jgi:hypothetical protein